MFAFATGAGQPVAAAFDVPSAPRLGPGDPVAL
jgi:hypothetical protein